MSIDEEGTLRLVNNPTFTDNDGPRLWLASLTLDVYKRPDGKVFPFENHRRLEIMNGIQIIRSKLQKGDLLFLDNFALPTDLPYRNGQERRRLMTTYIEPKKITPTTKRQLYIRSPLSMQDNAVHIAGIKVTTSSISIDPTKVQHT
jgi:hypothetical protein